MENEGNHFYLNGDYKLDTTAFVQCNSTACARKCARNVNVDYKEAAPIYKICKDYIKKEK